jgi:hypothetical protein
MPDMDKDLFAEQPYGKLALKRMAPFPAGFRLYEAGWLGEKPEDWKVMKVIGAEFRIAKSGPYKGKLSIMVKGTQRTAHVTRDEMQVTGEPAA